MPAVEIADRFALAQPKYKQKIKTFAGKNFRSLPGLEQQDLEGEILEVLWLACMKYDPDNGGTFSTFFWTCAQRRFLDLHKAASRKCRVGDYYRVWMDSDELKTVVLEWLEPSAEDEALARFTVREIFHSGPSEEI